MIIVSISGSKQMKIKHLPIRPPVIQMRKNIQADKNSKNRSEFILRNCSLLLQNFNPNVALLLQSLL